MTESKWFSSLLLYIDICTLDVDSGPCMGEYPRWFFNSTSKQCEIFIYGGCTGNRNKFNTLEKCVDVCGK